MRQAQVLAYGLDGRLAELVQQCCRDQGCTLRDVQHVKTCRDALRRAGPTVLVLKLGRDVEGELAILQQTQLAGLDIDVVVIGEADNPLLAGLSWDLGAACVLFPPQPADLLPGVIVRLLSARPEEP
jgi:DNA-binding NtrC family response regulator